MSEAAAIRGERGWAGDWRAWLLAVIALAGAVVVIALVITQGRAARARDEALGWQSHSYEVMIRAQALSNSVSRAEATLGRFVISGDKNIGRQYYAEWIRAGTQINGLAATTRDSHAQQLQIARLREAYDARGRELSEVALYSNFKRNNAALRRYYDYRESASLRELTTRLDGIIAAERSLLESRTRNARLLIERSNASSWLLAIFGLAIVVGAMVLGLLMTRAMAERAVADAEASSERQRAIELEHAVEAATAELRAEAQVREAAEAQLRQAQKMEAVGQLTGGIAHDFNNMLAVVLGGLELARRRIQEGGKDAQRHIENAMEGANRAAALTRRLLAFSRSEPVLPEAVDPAALVRGMSELLDRALGDGITVEAVAMEPGWQVWADRHQLENAVLNLAVNARDAMNGRGTIRIATGGATLEAGQVGDCVAGEFASISVSDTGVGMTPEVIERVFEPFFTTKPVGKGTGLGLSQIFGFVRQSGGEIAIDSAPGSGTTVMLYLPRHAAAQAPRAVEIVASEAGAPRTGLDILVVEDDPRVLNATVGALEELGHRVVGCGDPLQVPALLGTIGPRDLIVSDVLMPGQTGPEMIAALGAALGDAAVLFVTGYAGDAQDAELFGDRLVLRKPFTMAALARAVDDAMAASAGHAPSPRAVNG